MGTRTYLRSDDRRRQLLDAASRRFVREGYAGLSMVALAHEAGVSRRLVYDHFPDLPSLYEAFFADRASRYLAAIDEAVAAAEGDRGAAFAGAFAQLLDMPADDQRAIRLLVTDPGLPDLEPLRARFRQHIEERWLGRPPLDATASGRAVLWTLVGGLFNLAELVSRDEVPRDAAMRIATDLVAALSHTPRDDLERPRR